MTGAKPRRRARRGEGPALRAEILAAARALLKDTGSEDAVSIRAVAAAVGVSTPAVYLHFADKSQLIEAVCEAVFLDLDAAMQEARAQATDPMEALRLFGLAYVQFAMAHPEHYRIALMSRVHVGIGGSTLEGSPAFAHLLELVAQCQDAGVFSKDIPCERIGATLWAAAHGVAAMAVTKPHLLEQIGAQTLADDVISTIGVGVAVMHRLPDEPDGTAEPKSLGALLDETLGAPYRVPAK